MRARLAVACLAVLVALGGLWLILWTPSREPPRPRIAVAAAVRGAVERRAFLEPLWSPLAEGAAILDRDEIRTGPGAAARLRFDAGSEVSLGEKALVQLKPAAVQVAAGAVEGASEGDGPFQVSAGGMTVNFRVKKSLALRLTEGSPGKALLEARLAAVRAQRPDLPELPALQARVAALDAGASGAEAGDALWDELARLEKAAAGRKSMKIAVDQDSSVRAQVEEGEILMSLDKEGKALSVKEGEGVLLGAGGEGAGKVQLLPAPAVEAPAAGAVVWNRTEVACAWKPVAGAAGYVAEFAEGADLARAAVIRRTTDPALVVGGLRLGASYTWRLRAVDQKGFEGRPFTGRFRLEEDRSPPSLTVEEVRF